MSGYSIRATKPVPWAPPKIPAPLLEDFALKSSRWILSAAAAAAFMSTTACSNPADQSTPAVVTDAAPIAESPEPAVLVADPAAALTETESTTTTATTTALPFVASVSRIDFVGSKVTGSHEGGFKQFTGDVSLSPEGDKVTGITAQIDMNSTWSDNDNLTGHLKAPDFFDVAQYPKAEFVSTAITEGGEKAASHTITGNFTLHGVTKSISFPATIAVNDGVATIASDFFIKRKDFGIEYPGKPDDLIRDEVVIKLALKAGE